MSNLSTLKVLYAKKLLSSVLTLNDAKKLGFSLLPSEKVLDLGASFESRGGFVIPYFTPTKKAVRIKEFFRFRYLEDPSSGWIQQKPRRYTQPKGTGVRAYFPPLVNWSIALQPEVSLLITEGELKAACATKHGFPTIGLGGVWSFKGKDTEFLPELDAINWKNRTVAIVFDNDIQDKPAVRVAMLALANELKLREANVFQAEIPPGEAKGIDDFIRAYGSKAFEEMLSEMSEIETSAGALLELNRKLAYIEDSGEIVDLQTGHSCAPQNLKYTNHGGLRHTEEKLIPGTDRMDSKEKQTSVVWLTWKGRRSLKRMVYTPGEESVTEAGEFNLWKGWGLEPKKATQTKHMKPWHEFMALLFGKTEEGLKARKWFEQWAAFPMQNPGAKLYTGCLFYSISHGTGKTFLGEILRKIYGDNGSTPDHNDLLGDWNSWQSTHQFVMVDEVAGGDKRISATKLKGLITSESFRLREKYAKDIQLQSCANFFFTTNYPDAIRIEYDDRRFFVWEVFRKGTPEFYAYLDKWFREDGCAYLFDYFRKLDLTGFEPRGTAMHTKAKESMAFLSSSDLASWVHAARVTPEAFCAHSDLDALKVMPVDQMRTCYISEGGKKVSMRAMRVVIQEQGMTVRNVVPKGEKFEVELVALGNQQDMWKAYPNSRWISALAETSYATHQMEKY